MAISQGSAPALSDMHAAIERWADTVWRVARGRLRNQHDAEDAFQNTFLALCRTRPHFESLEHQKAWLLRTTCNCCNEIARKRTAHPESLFDETAPLAMSTEAPDYDEELKHALERLTPAQRTAVHLYYYEGYSTEEIASITSEKPATVRSHLYRARCALRIELEGNEVNESCMNANLSSDMPLISEG